MAIIGSSGTCPFQPLANQADPKMGHLLELAHSRRQRRIKHLVNPILFDIGHV
jgi:hypothetical protein